MVFISRIADIGFIWILIGVVGLLVTERGPAAWRLLLTLLCIYLIAELALKGIFGRPRPFDVIPGLQLLTSRMPTSSFPSAHAALGFGGAIAGARVFPGAGWILWPLGILVACSRVYLGVHWPSDIIAGALMGCGCAWFVLGGRAVRLRG